jgi:hypothetical protein
VGQDWETCNCVLVSPIRLAPIMRPFSSRNTFLAREAGLAVRDGILMTFTRIGVPSAGHLKPPSQ